MRGKKFAVGCGICLVMGLVSILSMQQGKAESRQKGIADEIVRFHVIANSDSDADQALKMKIKEHVVTYLQETMGEATSVRQAKRIIQEKLPQITRVAKEKVIEEGYTYDVKAELANCYFPVKEYGDLTFPAGEYEALRIQIGESRGRNWWCVMYPSLCFVDSVYQVVPEESKEKLRMSLTEEEYSSLLDGGENVVYSSRLLEWVQGFFSVE